MLVRLADWCFRQPPPGRRSPGSPPWWAPSSWPARSAGSSGRTTCSRARSRKAASDTLEERFPQQAGDTVQIVVHSDAGVTSPEVRARAEKIFADVADSDHVVSVASPFTDGGAGQISADGTTAYADVALDKTDNEFTPDEAKALVEPILAAGDDTLQVEVGGPVAALSQTAPVGSEGIGLDRRGHHPAGHLRLRGGDGPAADHRPVRPRHRDGARRGPAPAWSTSRTGRRPPRRWSASASASTTRCSSSPGSAAAWPTGRSRGGRR